MTAREPERTATAEQLADERAKLDRAASGAWRDVRAASERGSRPAWLPTAAELEAASDPDPRHVCGNESAHAADYGRPIATVKMTWPDGRFNPAYACDDCAVWSLQTYVLDEFEDAARHPVLIEPEVSRG